MNKLKWLLALSLLYVAVLPAVAESKSTLPMDRVYQGAIHLPDFNGRDSTYAAYKTRITDEMSTGPNFAGHYAIVSIGCGTSCNFSFVGDVATGKVFAFPYGGESFYMLQKNFSVKSNYVSVRWVDGEACYADNLEWNGESFTSSGRRTIGSRDKCDY